MSVIVTANYKGEIFEVEIFRDGSIEFPGCDFQYEKAMAEFAPPGSATVQFYELWVFNQLDVIFSKFELLENHMNRLSIDCAEHVLGFFEDEYENDKRPRNAINAARDFLNGKISISALKDAQDDAWHAALDVENVSEAASRTARATAWVIKWKWSAVWEAAKAAACNVSSDSNSANWDLGYNAETSWQIRRFVDCMEAIGQGKDWPDMKGTP